MLTRRRFVSLAACAAATQGLAQVGASSSPAVGRTSVMMWTLKDRGTFAENLERVAQAGYRHVELVDEWKSWSEADWPKELDRIRRLGLTVDTIAALGLGFATPGGAGAFLEGLQRLLPTAKRLGCENVILLSGPLVPSAANGTQYRAAVETLRRAAPILTAAGLVGVVEPVDRLEQPQIYLDGVTEAFRMVAEVQAPSVKVLYDLYHEQRTHGNLTEKLEKNAANIGLVHVADVPGRHQPGMGEMDYRDLYQALKRIGYEGIVAMEFYPAGDVVEVLRQARVEAEEALG